MYFIHGTPRVWHPRKEAKAELDILTDKGRLIEAVVATHPFHTLAFPDFYAQYPAARLLAPAARLRSPGMLAGYACFHTPKKRSRHVRIKYN